MLWPDLKYAVRGLVKTPGNTLVALTSLGLALGAVTAGLSVTNALFARDLPVAAPQQLVALGKVEQDLPDVRGPLLLSQLDAIRSRNTGVFTHVFAWRDVALRNIEVNGARYLGTVNEVSGDFFSALGVQPLMGRVFKADEVASNGTGAAARVAVLDYRCWEQHFAGDPAVVGKTVIVDGLSLEIIGVMPRSFTGVNISAAPEAIVPIGFDLGGTATVPMPAGGSSSYSIAARMSSGTTLEAANAFVQSIWPSVVNATLPPNYQGARRTRFLATTIALESLRTGTTSGGRGLRSTLKGPLTKLLGLSALVLLVAYLNLAGLMLARAAARRHEISLRAALGGGRLALIRVAALEAVVVSTAGALLGLLAAFWTGPLLVRSLLRSAPLRPLVFDPSPDLRVAAVAIAMAVAIAVVCALIPARHVIGRNAASVLPQNTRTVVRGSGALLQKCVIYAQVSLAFVLTTGALLFGQTLYNLRTVQPGFRMDGVVSMRLMPHVPQQTIPNRTAYYRDVADALVAVPGIESVSYALVPPLDPDMRPMPVSDARTPQATDANVNYVSPGFFHTLGVSVIAGREFEWNDHERAPRVAIISDALATQLFPGKDAIGQTLDVPAMPYAAGAQVVGVVNSASLWTLRSHRPRAVYLALMQAPLTESAWLQLHTTGEMASVARAADGVLESKRYHYASTTQSLAERMRYALVDERVLSMLSMFFAGLTILLASVGLYGVLSYSVTRRSAEIGVRMAIGAQRADIVRMIVRDAAWLLVWSLAIGIPMAIIGLRVAADTLFGVTAHDLPTFAVSAIVLTALTLIAAYVPGRRASRIDPLLALRIE